MTGKKSSRRTSRRSKSAIPVEQNLHRQPLVEHNTDPKRFRPPTSGNIIGALVELLDVKPESLRSRQVRRFFDGEVVSVRQRRKAFESFAAALLDNGIVPRSAFKGLDLPIAEVLASAIAFHAEHWDHLGAYTYSHSGRVSQQRDAVMAYLRMVVVDAAVRGFALLWLMDAPEPGDETPSWAKERGVARWFRKLLSEAGLTREKFSELVDVSDRTVDMWLDDEVRPSADNIGQIAAALSDRLPGRSPQHLRDRLRRAYFLSGVCSLLAESVSRADVEMLGRALCVLITRVLPGFRSAEQPPTELARAIQMETLLLGCGAPRAKHVLDLMWKQEGNGEWRTDIQAAKVNWIQRLQHQIARLGTGESEGPVMHKSEVAKVARRALLEVSARSFEALAREEPGVALKARVEVMEVLEACVAAVPTDPWLHLQLCSVLDDLGDVDGAVKECWLAATLEPGWELPLDEIGIIYLNSGRNEEARDHLEDIVNRNQDPPWNMLMNLGVARMRMGDPSGGLSMLERALDIEPNHPIALAAAARCARLSGHKIKANRYARRARLFGDWSDQTPDQPSTQKALFQVWSCRYAPSF